jgi:hypothetical protein
LERPTWAPGEIDLEQPSAARVYDYYLGGSHNFAADRQMAQQAIGIMPDLPQIMQAGRAFLRRAVRHLVDSGITQFIDIGSGIPTVGNVHEVVQEVNPDARVVYVDIDPVAVAHSRAILAGNLNAAVIQADLRKTRELLAHADLRRLIDLDQPVGVLLFYVLHFVGDDDDPVGVVDALHEAAAPGSFVAISHASKAGQPEKVDAVEEVYARTPDPMTFRSRAEVSRLFGQFQLVEPGVVPISLWRPEQGDDMDEARAERMSTFAGVGRKT